MTTLDSLLSEFNLQGPLLLKLDIQGFELEVLRGSRIALDFAEFVLLEVSTLNYNRGAPLVAEVLDFMNQRGFVLFDIADLDRNRMTGPFPDGCIICEEGFANSDSHKSLLTIIV